MLDSVESIVVSGAAAVTAIAAVWGVTSWRRQLRGQTEYEVARMALRAGYRVRDALGMVRSPFMSSGEATAAVAEVDPDCGGLDPGSTEARARSLAAGYQVRWRSVVSALSDLDLARVEAEALWASQAADSFADLRSCATELNAALTMYLRRQQEPFRNRPPSDTDEEMERIVFGGCEDDYSKKVRSAVHALETFFRSKMK